MTTVEQHKLVLDLCDHIRKMTRAEQEAFDMLFRRDKDDEDLDLFAKKELTALHDKYVKRPKSAVNPLDALFKK
jgi:hypothetical protein